MDKCVIKLDIYGFKCLRCEHKWLPRWEMSELEKPLDKNRIKTCPRCKTPYWDIEKKKGDKNL